MTTETKTAKPLTPKQARTFKQVCSVPRDNVSTGRAWFMIDEGTVHIYEQKPGHPSTGNVTLTRADFETFARWYETGRMRKAAR